MNRAWLPLLALLIIACSEDSNELKKEGKKEVTEMAKPKFYGYPDMPQDDSLITSIGAGKVILGQDLNLINTYYDSVQDIKIYMDGVEWPGKKIILKDGEWIIAFSNNSVRQITSIRTNSKQFRSKSGIRIGMSLSDTLSTGSIGIDYEDKSLILIKDGVEVKIDQVNETNFFRNKNTPIDRLNKNAIIREFLIKCGDC
jgi:hypothetical protein